MTLTYKFPKKHKIVDETKIYLIYAKKSKRSIDTKVVFSISQQDDSYKEFIRLSQDWVENKEWLFNQVDVETYKQEEDAETIDFFAEEYCTPIPGRDVFSWNPPPSAYSRLLDKRVTGFWKQQDTLFSFDAELGLFTFSEWVTNCATTRGIIKDLHKIKKGKDIGHFVTESYLLHLLQALDSLWY